MSVPYPPAQGPYGPAPIHIDPKELRPGRVWYIVGALVLVCAFVTALVGFVFSMFSTVALPDFEARANAGEEVVFTVDETDFQLGLYASPTGDQGMCSLVLPDGTEERFGWPGYSHYVEVGGERWELVGSRGIGEAGEYTLTCEAEPGVDTFAVADIGDGGAGFARGLLSSFLWALGAPLLGMAIGLPILIVTGTRRSRHKRRLMTERRQWPQGGPHPA